MNALTYFLICISSTRPFNCCIIILATEEDDAHLEEFRNGQSSGRRAAICSEIEKTKNRFKVNGARMSLHDMRGELGKYEMNENGIAEAEVIEENLNTQDGKYFRSSQLLECFNLNTLSS